MKRAVTNVCQAAVCAENIRPLMGVQYSRATLSCITEQQKKRGFMLRVALYFDAFNNAASLFTSFYFCFKNVSLGKISGINNDANAWIYFTASKQKVTFWELESPHLRPRKATVYSLCNICSTVICCKCEKHQLARRKKQHPRVEELNTTGGIAVVFTACEKGSFFTAVPSNKSITHTDCRWCQQGSRVSL